MKTLLIAFVTVVLSLDLAAQPLGPAYVVYFTDKSNSPYSLENPSEFLTAAALDRRARQNIPVQEDDLPVNTAYLQAVAATGAQIAMTSRWFNKAAVWVNDPDIIGQLEALSFVSSVEPMSSSNKRNRKSLIITEKPFFAAEEYGSIPAGLKSKSGTAGFYNYGSSLNQIEMINGVGLHNQGFRGQGMTIAVLDAGFTNVDIISAFDSLRANNRILGTRDFVQPGDNVYAPPIHPHGTMVLSTMGANLPGQMVGTAPEASYWLLRTEDANGPWGNSEYLMEEYFWIAGAEFADSVGVWLINSSLGYYTFDDPSQSHTYADMDGNTTPVTLGADRAASKGIMVVNSAGNSGASAWKYIIAPSDGHQVMAVGAVNAQGQPAGFTSQGPSFDGRVKPDVAAQGSGTAIVNDGGGVTFGSGTSFSSPVIAGMTACLWQTNLDANREEVYQAIIQTASQYQSPDTFIGYGIANFGSAHFLILSNNELPEKHGLIKMFPNPAYTHFYLETYKPGDTIISYSISDISGRLLTAEIFNPTNSRRLRHSISTLPAGVYFVRIQLQQGAEVLKLVKTGPVK